MTKLQKGDKAPDFKGIDQNGNPVSLADFKGKKLILYFYPKDNTPGCTNEACNFRDHYDFWLSKGYAIVGVSPDSVASHQKFIEKHQLPFTLISDPEKVIIKAYGAWGPKKLYGREYEGLIRSTFVIDEEGKIVEVFGKVKTKEHTEQIVKKLNLE
ncbi:thioredoxin-dependent thiol peroxidase [Candidatus Sulfidibacterium hydrothermale]|jgi:peroxiredoxin Q/BCP|uniref:thioredoxin-dependent thiol peroxidase n=1 Tax=Candidatus Sulfidibacterium hydrothermale TaxID=2875962 RepID=UPI001F0A6891|nr:thioredoxin-dependent thiol peroxidase [Candidatus Sulfidibacterium hydrothermale]UBM62806.1 thioredoxin-dependent thiol peroxidase [Candidatus Sulfidibacterium hydrothermale]